jgi:hypothetical protein
MPVVRSLPQFGITQESGQKAEELNFAVRLPTLKYSSAAPLKCLEMSLFMGVVVP